MMRTIPFYFLVSAFAIVSCQTELTTGTVNPSEFLTKGGGPSMETDSLTDNTVDSLLICKEDALKIVEPITKYYPDRWVDISDKIIPAGTRIAYNMLGHLLENEEPQYFISPDFDAWLVVVDFDPTFLGRQTLLHIFVNVQSGEILEQRINGRAIISWDTSRNIYLEDDKYQSITPRDHSRPTTTRTTPIKWAVIISGGNCPENNYSCFYEDTKLLYNTLVGTLGYSGDYIFCLMSDGDDPGFDQRIAQNIYINSDTDFDGDNVSDVFSELTKSNISFVFSYIRAFSVPGDEVLVALIGHGEEDYGFRLWGYEVLTPVDLGIQLAKLNDSSVMMDVVLGQSYSGSFIQTISGTNRTISTSCSASETASASYYGLNASCYFLRRWINSIPIYDDVSANDAYVSPIESFVYAQNSLATIPGCTEHPQYDSTPSDFGASHSLKGEIIPSVTGSNYLSTTANSVYTIINRPPSGSVTWSVGSNMNLISYTDSTATIRGVISEPLQFCATTAPTQAAMVVNGKCHNLIKNIDSVWKSGYFVGGNNIWGNNGTYYVRHLGGEYGHLWFCDNPAWQIVDYNDYIVNVLEGPTTDPVNLIVSFYDPFGNPIIVMDCVN